jgi:carboxyl-terminal processing protease
MLKLCTATVLVVAALVGTTGASAGQEPSGRPPVCEKLPEEIPPRTPTTVITIGQAYYCVLDHYVNGPNLDTRSLLQPAFAALTQELQRRGLDQTTASAPVLTGREDDDWRSFSRSLQQIMDALPDDAAREAVASAALSGMVAGLDDNHARWAGFEEDEPGVPVGVWPSHIRLPGEVDPAASEPVFVEDVLPGSAAEAAGIELGDEILSINGVPPYIAGTAVPGIVDWLMEAAEGDTVRMALRRPSTGDTFEVTMTVVTPPRPTPPQVESGLLPGDVAYATLPGFDPELANQVLTAIEDMRAGRTLRGVVLDLRGNTGGAPQAVSRLLGVWAHGKTTGYLCDAKDRCTPQRTDDTVPLVNLPLVVLTDRVCASACDAFVSAVRKLEPGTLIGTRTGGEVSGPAIPYLLNDGTGLLLPTLYHLGADRERVDTVGVPPDHYAPVTAASPSAGQDPGIEKALAVLDR